MADTVHSIAKEGFKAGSFYDQNRPSYSEVLVKHVVSQLHSGPADGVKYNILELGAGTGKFTRQILKHLDKTVSYLATDPSEGFLSVLQNQSPDLDTLVCSAKEIPLPDNSVQNILCAQSFHWFANHDCLQEIHRVLSENGRFMCVWNYKDLECVEWCGAMEKILSTYYSEETPRFITGKWRHAINTFPQLQFVEETQLDGITMKGDKGFIVDHYSSISVIAQMGDDEKSSARQKFRDVLDRTFSDDDPINIPFVTLFYCAKKV